jgi:hypothetical protein
MLYKLLADSVVAVHLAYVGFVVVAQALILLGVVCRWPWVRNLRFRVIHLVMVEVVALEGWFGVVCPMTDWDTQLRVRSQAGDQAVAVQPPAPVGPAIPPMLETPPPGQPPAQQPPMQQQAPPPAVTPQPEPEPPLPPAGQPEPVADAGQGTFVGRMLSAILYLEVPQRVLDTWYVRFGLVTLGLFVLFPPRVGTWTVGGLSGVILLWTGLLFTCTAIHQRISREGLEGGETLTPLEFGIWVIGLGAACIFWACLHRFWTWLHRPRAPEGPAAAASPASL